MKALSLLICAACIAAVSASEVSPAHFYKHGGSQGGLVLVDGKLITVQPPSNADASPGTPAIYRAEVKCGSEERVVGDCSWTGTYLTNEGEGLVNYLVTCVLEQSCGSYRPGSLSMVGRAKGVDSTSYVELPIVGGTGPYANARGIYSWEDGVNTFRISRK